MPGNEKRYKFRSRSYLAKLENHKALEDANKKKKVKSIEVNAQEEPHAVKAEAS